MMKHIRLPIALTVMLVATQSFAAETTGAGSTFVSPVMTKWIDTYKAKTGNTVSYQAVGSSTAVEWPVGLGGKGNDGVASLVSLVPGAIGYLEYAYALQRLDKISFGVVQNSAGHFVVPDAASFQAAAASADWKAEKDFHLVLTNAPGEDAYPITATTFVVMPRKPKSPERSAATIEFVRWSLDNGRSQAETLNYVPLPPALIKQIELYWQQ